MPQTLFFQNNNANLVSGAHLGGIWFPHPRGVAFHNEDTLFASGINSGGSVQWLHCPNANLAALKAWIAKTFRDHAPSESDYKPGTAYKRIRWPLANGGYLAHADDTNLDQSLVVLRILLDRMEQTFETVEPAKANLQCYGLRIRELLLLACMEVESSWTAVLKENQYQSAGPMTTRDYVKLLEPMLLNAYTVSLRNYPEFPPFTPFDKWDKGSPTKSLPWYDAYNKTKHDREQNLSAATLEHAVHAVGAAMVMISAQRGFTRSHNENNAFVRNAFSMKTEFDRYPTSCYISVMSLNHTPSTRALAQPVAQRDWTLINYPFA